MPDLGQPVPSTVTVLARAKITDGKSVSVTVPESTVVVAGMFILLGGFFGVALQSITTEAGETASLILAIEEAEYETDAIDVAQTFAVGTPLFWDAAAKKFTETAVGHRFVGIVTSAKDANNVICLKLSPQANGVVQGVAVADVASADAGGAYTAAEQALINEIKEQLNALLVSLRDGNVIA
jgi:predicted RecA/RadA family phage recombinase